MPSRNHSLPGVLDRFLVRSEMQFYLRAWIAAVSVRQGHKRLQSKLKGLREDLGTLAGAYADGSIYNAEAPPAEGEAPPPADGGQPATAAELTDLLESERAARAALEEMVVEAKMQNSALVAEQGQAEEGIEKAMGALQRLGVQLKEARLENAVLKERLAAA
eukprot:CAMPEP_0204370098 /NCGR_PEP_ID=MMETSP0469-20131031/45485_1 /ASSEMBLY_ACC=CAM_ASM_000384 /TAXON_ID=2969 /ORGANISM="Oxyrrhis marina" /LENGTH=161 /DNA_ID=CAMNT_0051359971 /DNA_START=34 /DNA_END=515 /DNA_ORIENTATION=-